MMRQLFFLMVYALVGYPVLAADSHKGIRLSADKCYVGLPVRISLFKSGNACNKIEVISDKGRLEKKEGCNWILIHDSTGQVTISVYKTKGKKRKLVEAISVFIHPAPAPIVTVGGLVPGNLSRGAFQVQGGLSAHASYELTGYCISYQVMSFRILVYDQSGIIHTESINGNAFTESCIAVFKKLQPGSCVLLYDITLHDYHAQTLFATPFEYKLN